MTKNSLPLKRLPFVVIPLLLMNSTGCSTVPRTVYKLEDAKSREVMIVLEDGRHYHFPEDKWSIDNDGNLTGWGVECSLEARSFHKDIQAVRAFTGTIQASSIRNIIGVFPPRESRLWSGLDGAARVVVFIGVAVAALILISLADWGFL